MTAIHIHRPSEVVGRRVRDCPTCDRRRRFVVRFYVWYDTRFTCCGCGDTWSGGWRAPRPFQRNWRADAIRRAREAWALAVPRPQERAAIHALWDREA